MAGVLLRHLLDVDAAHVAEDRHRLLGDGVVGDAEVVLLCNIRFRLNEDTDGHLAADLQHEDLGGGGLRFVRRVGELDAARLHSPAGEHLRLKNDSPTGVRSDALGVFRRLRDTAGRRRHALPGEELLSFKFVEAHRKFSLGAFVAT